jgi:hypothetical protein
MQRGDDPSKSGSLDSPTATGDDNKNTTKKKRRKKPKDCPRRPLSAYNFFFKDERKKILDAIPSSDRNKSEDDKIRESITWPGKKRPPHGKIGFESLAKVIGERWKHVDSARMKYYKDLATNDLQRYAEEMKVYEEKQNAKRRNTANNNANGDEGNVAKTQQEDSVHKDKNKRKISTSSHEYQSSKDESSHEIMETMKRKSPTRKQRRQNYDSHDRYCQKELEDDEISPQDIDQDDPFVNFDASAFVNSFSFDNEDFTTSTKLHHGNNTSTLLNGIGFNESWITDLNQSESN